jgi:hypothetical protein
LRRSDPRRGVSAAPPAGSRQREFAFLRQQVAQHFAAGLIDAHGFEYGHGAVRRHARARVELRAGADEGVTANAARLSWTELATVRLSTEAITDVGFAFLAVTCVAIGNLWAQRGAVLGAPVVVSPQLQPVSDI